MYSMPPEPRKCGMQNGVVILGSCGLLVVGNCHSYILLICLLDTMITPRTLCSNYRPITLLSVFGKVLAHVLLARIQPLIDQSRRVQQPDFTAATDAILALRLQSELHREFNRPLNVAVLGPDLQNILRFIIRLSKVYRKIDLR